MTTTATHPYVEALLSGTRELPRLPHAWLNERRGAALERANALAVPTTRDEEWRFTDLTPLTRLQFRPSEGASSLAADALEPYRVPEAHARLVFVDGVFNAALSQTGEAGSGARALALGEALDSYAAAIEPHLAQLAQFEHDVFVALNTSHLRDAALVVVPKHAACEKPVHVLYVSTQAGTVSHPRCLLVAEAGAQCTLIEEFISLDDAATFTNGVTEIAVAPDAMVRHVKLQSEAVAAFHIARCAVALERDASYTSQTITRGARLSRFDLSVTLGGEGASAHVDGLALISGRQLADTHTLIDHAWPNGRSAQLHKTIVGGGAHAVFNGKILVRPGAQQTDSTQESRNLLLSDKAQVDTKPQLEIFADDVKCAHGATVGQLDLDQLFYLRSRGLPDQTARNVLTYAFGASVIRRIPIASIVNRLERAVMAQTGAAASSVDERP
jgi:Fe-S cluster assembly protein SufD